MDVQTVIACILMVDKCITIMQGPARSTVVDGRHASRSSWEL